jgi:hypothetical protein
VDDTEYTDDLLPLDGGLINLDPPEEQKLEEQIEGSAVMASAPIIKSLLEWFDIEIALTDSIDGIDLEANVPLAAQILARQLLKAKLVDSKGRLMAQRDAFIRNHQL